MVGGQGTGKTSLLRLLLETAEISPTATVDQRTDVEHFLHGPVKHTQAIRTACVEICESRFDRVLFSVIDTPGLDFLESRELKLERQVSSIIKYLDTQYADTMSEVCPHSFILRYVILIYVGYRNQKSFGRTKGTCIFICKCFDSPRHNV
jgi:septin family protein